MNTSDFDDYSGQQRRRKYNTQRTVVTACRWYDGRTVMTKNTDDSGDSDGDIIIMRNKRQVIISNNVSTKKKKYLRNQTNRAGEKPTTERKRHVGKLQ